MAKSRQTEKTDRKDRQKRQTDKGRRITKSAVKPLASAMGI